MNSSDDHHRDIIPRVLSLCFSSFVDVEIRGIVNEMAHFVSLDLSTSKPYF